MTKVTRLRLAPFALLVLLVLLAFLVVKRQDLTTEEAEDDAVQNVVKAEDTVVRHELAALAVLAVVGLFAFVTWIAIHAKAGEGNATPPTGESSASGTTAIR
jgi:hypothetical protein